MSQIILHFSFLSLPLGNASDWLQDSFKKIPANQVNFSSSGLEIKVSQSASPLFYQFLKPLKVTGFKIKFNLTGQPPTAKNELDFEEDSVLRVGLIQPGEARLNAFQRMMAPDWLLHLEQRFPKPQGVGKIVFLNTSFNPKMLGKKRNSSQSDLVSEEIVHVLSLENSEHVFSYKPEKPIPSFGVWLSSDGDQTGAAFSIKIKSIELESLD